MYDLQSEVIELEGDRTRDQTVWGLKLLSGHGGFAATHLDISTCQRRAILSSIIIPDLAKSLVFDYQTPPPKSPTSAPSLPNLLPLFNHEVVFGSLPPFSCHLGNICKSS